MSDLPESPGARAMRMEAMAADLLEAEISPYKHNPAGIPGHMRCKLATIYAQMAAVATAERTADALERIGAELAHLNKALLEN